ncbi:MAG: hypothetical protein OSB76_05670 [Alphaproteobacteria bacterium]|jgi:hypothetical protein|nr:hypothetical protein [Alphaproteobacteria bacterium]
MNDPVAHAKTYPFPVPGRSYVFRNGTPHDLDDHGFDRTGRTPVLAAGSNQSHEQLARKYSVLPGHVEIPIQRGLLDDFDSVYAAHLADYGSVPSTFHPSLGTRVTTYVLWLDDAQLNRMHETERNYTYDRLDGIRVEIEGVGDIIDRAFAYTAVVGCLNVNGAPVALAEISAEGRILRAMSQPDMLDHVRGRLDPDVHLDTFIQAHIEGEALRRERTLALSSDSLPLVFERTVLGEF